MSKWVRILLSLALLSLVIAFADWREVWNVLRNVDLRWVGGALILAILDRVVTNYRWQILLDGRGVALGFAQLFRVQLAANFIGAFLPGFIGVDAVRIAALCRSGERPAPVIAATLVDRATLAIATLLIGSATAMWVARTRLPPHIMQFVLTITLIALLLTAMCLHPFVRKWVRLSILPRVPQKFRHTVSEVADAALAYRQEGRIALRIVIVTLVLFLIRLLFSKAVAYSCGVDIPFIDLLFVIPILWVVVMLPITIGGIGVQDAGYVVLMALIGVGAPVAVSMSLVEHIVARVTSLPGALFMADVAGPRK